MFGLGTVRFWIYVALALAFAAMAWTAKHYHEEWIQAQNDLAVKQLELENVKAAAKACSDATILLKKQSEEKSEIVAKAQAQAAVVARANQATAQKLLSMTPSDPNKCNAATKLFQDWRAGKVGK